MQASRSAGGGLVVGRRALHRRSDPCSGEGQTVTEMGRLGLVGVAGAVQRPVQPVPGAVAGEHPAGAVGPVGRGRQADHQQAGVGVAEPGHAAGPVLVVAVGGPLLSPDPLPPLHQPGAHPARGHLRGHLDKDAARAGGLHGRSGYVDTHHGHEFCPYFGQAGLQVRHRGRCRRAVRAPRADAHHGIGSAGPGTGSPSVTRGCGAGPRGGRATGRVGPDQGGICLAHGAHGRDGGAYSPGLQAAGAAEPGADRVRLRPMDGTQASESAQAQGLDHCAAPPERVPLPRWGVVRRDAGPGPRRGGRHLCPPRPARPWWRCPTPM